jgi:hypothetical protein
LGVIHTFRNCGQIIKSGTDDLLVARCETSGWVPESLHRVTRRSACIVATKSFIIHNS